MSNYPAMMDDKYGYEDEDGIFFPLGTAPELVQIHIDIDNLTTIFELRVFYKGASSILKIPRDDIVRRNNLIRYAGQGLDVTEGSVFYLMSVILQMEENIDPRNVHYVHRSLGWDNDESKFPKSFKKYKIRYENSISTYTGDYLIAPMGTWDRYKSMLQEHVVPSPALTFAFVSGLSAVLNGYSEQFCDGETIIIHFTGGSSTGKTTAAMLAASTAGCADPTKNSLFKTWGATQNALLSTMVGNYGFPIVFDEASALRAKDFSALMYALSSGRDKSRLNQDYSLTESKGFRTVVISTGEKSILSNCNGNNGLNVRIIEVEGVQFTDSAETAEKIKYTCLNNYGHALDLMTEYLIKGFHQLNGEKFEAKLFAVHDKYRRKFREVCQPNAFVDRLSKKYALLMLTAKLARTSLGLDLNCNALFDFIVEIDRRNSLNHSRDLGMEFMERLLGFISSNPSKFVSEEDTTTSDTCFGRLSYDKVGNLDKVYIQKEDFKYLTRRIFKFEDEGVIINELKRKNLLSCDKDGHNTRKIVVNPSIGAVRCYVLNIPQM